MDKIVAKHSSIVIDNYLPNENEKIEKMLSVWDDRCFKYKQLAYHYDEDNRRLIIPRGLDLNFLAKELDRPVEINRDCSQYDKIHVKLTTEPRDDTQRKCICFLIGEGDFKYTANYSQSVLTVDPGEGKTYCSIAAASFLQMRCIIILPTTLLVKQWVNTVVNMTDTYPEEVCFIKGSPSIKKLFKDKNPRYKFYVTTHATLRAYAKKNGWEKIGDLFEHLKIGVKIVDEAHMEFRNVMLIDFFTNVKKTIYLTATLERSQHGENNVCKLAFKNIPKYGQILRNDKKKYIVYVPVIYNTHPSTLEQSEVKGPKGFNNKTYIEYQMKKETMYDVLKFVIDTFKDKEGRMLITSPKIDSSFKIKDYIEEYCPYKSVGVINSTVPDDEKDRIKAECDIVSSTIKSTGTGFDMSGLRYNITIEQFTSSVISKQLPYRARRYEDKYVFYIEIMDFGFKDVKRMYNKRLSIFKQRCAAIKMIEYKE